MRQPNREEVKALTSWCQVNHLTLQISKTKDMITVFKRQRDAGYTSILIGDAEVERVSSFR